MSIDLALFEAKIRPLFNEIEKELNKNTQTIDLRNDMQPGEIYFKPTIVEINTHLGLPYRAGNIKDFVVSKKFLENNKKTIHRMLGYTFVSRFNYETNENTYKKMVCYLIEEIKISISELSKVDPTKLNWGQYFIKFGQIKDEEECAGFGFEITTNVLPIIELNERNENKYSVVQSSYE